jgi:hypothetical protein
MSEAKRSGRQARQAERSKKGTGLGRPFIVRNIPTYDVLSEENLIKIERAADRVLAETGIEFRDDAESLQMWRKAGAKVEGLLVKFEPGMLREILKSAPATFTQHARNPAKSVEIGGKSVVFSPAYGSPFVMDLDRGRRFGTIEDFRNFIKLAQSSPNFHHSGGTICEPTDVAVNKRHLDMVLAHMTLSDRPYMGSVTAENRSEDNIEMSRILFGADFGQCERELSAGVGRHDDQIAARLCPGQSGGGDRALHSGRGYGACDQCGRDRAIFGRNHGGLRADPIRTQGRAGNFWQLPIVDELAVGEPYLWHTRTGHRVDGDRPIGAALEPAFALQRQLHHL